MSKAQHLFYLVLTLKQEAWKHEVYLQIFHISGDRMIACGVDELSQGNHDVGISLGINIWQFMPLHLSAGTSLVTIWLTGVRVGWKPITHLC
jgi:hypothetical protein